MVAAMTELSDAEVFGSTASPQKEMSDADVFGSAPPPMAPSSTFGPKEVVANIQSGLGPNATAVMRGISKFPADFAQGLIDFVSKPGKGYEQGLTPDEQSDFGINGALATMGFGVGKFKMPRAAIEAITPHVQEFDAGVMQPAAQQFAHDAMQPPPEMLNEIKARSGQPENAPTGITAYHGSPYSFDAFSTEHIGKGEGAQSFGHGLYFAENVKTAEAYKENLGGQGATGTIQYSGGKYHIFDDFGASIGPFNTKAEAEAAKLPGSLYQVSINADPGAMLDWDKSLNEQPEIANAFEQITPQPGWLDRQIEGLKVIRHEIATDRNSTGEMAYGALSRLLGGDDKASAALADAGVPGIKYLDQGSRDAGEGTRNFVVFNEGDVQITHKNGEPIPTPMLDNIVAAKQSGIIGPEVSPPPAESPAASAQRAIPAAANQGDKITMTPAGEPIDAWAERFNRYVDKTETPDDFKTLVKDMAAQNNNFPEARSGSVAPEQIAKVAEAAGLDAADIDAGRLRTTYRTDDEIRTVATLLKKLGDDVQAAAEAVRGDDSPENLAKFQAAIIKRDYALEATVQTKVALRAEWGRSGNALQSILKAENEQAGLTKVLQDKGRSIDDLRDMALGMNGLDREQAAKVLTGMRGQAPHWFYWMWSQGLISGPFTHAKYVLANAAYAEMERGITTPLAAIIGKAKQVAGINVDRVFLGETAAGHWGMVSAIPDAIRTAMQTVKTGMRVPLESEKQLHDMAIAAGEKPSVALSRAVEPNLQPPRPIPGIWGRILGAPGDAASAIHVAFKVLGERANLEMNGYRKAAEEGLNHANDPDAFSRRWQYHVLNPTEKVLKDSVYQAYKDTFMQELGEHAKNFQQLVKKVPGLRWVIPFTHIPINLMKATYEYTPFAALDKEMRANILGENGGRAQDMAIARMTVGSSVMAYFTNAYMQGKVTSNYPTDQNERKDWALQQKPANSIQIGERWVSFERFGPAGDLAQIGAAIGSIAHRFAMDSAAPDKGVDEAFSHAIWATANAAANTIGNEVGFQSLRNFMDAIEDEKKGGSFASYQATSMLPFSSLLTQTASFIDPHMRIAKSMVAGLENRIPSLRETLLPKRDPLYGEPLENPGYHNILRSLPINTDPVKLELERVNLHPTAPRDVIGGVKLTPEQYDRYQATAGPLVQRALTSLVNHQGWQSIPLANRADTLRATISAMRQQAATAMQIAEPKLVQQGLQQRLDYISGKTNTPRPKRPPEIAAGQ